jgi:hypothetical protein
MKKTISIMLLAIIAVSGLTLALSYANAMPWMNFGMASNAGQSNRRSQQNLVRVNGVITQWGLTDVTGFLSTQARTAIFNVSDTRQLSSVSAIWTTNNSRPISTVRAKENFTYSFYSARLANASVSTLSLDLSLDNSNFFINGTWNVYNVTTTVTITTNSDGNITNIHRDSNNAVTKAYGELNITNNWTTFKLTINGIALTGLVTRSRTSTMNFNPFKFSDDDGTTTNSVTKTDVTKVKQAYGAMPGWGNYDQRMDFNNNYKIDITDVATVAANVE